MEPMTEEVLTEDRSPVAYMVLDRGLMHFGLVPRSVMLGSSVSYGKGSTDGEKLVRGRGRVVKIPVRKKSSSGEMRGFLT